MRVKFIKEEPFTHETWKNQNEVGQIITIHKGDLFKTGMWGCSESVLTDKNEWICDIDCKEFNDMFEIINN